MPIVAMAAVDIIRCGSVVVHRWYCATCAPPAAQPMPVRDRERHWCYACGGTVAGGKRS